MDVFARDGKRQVGGFRGDPGHGYVHVTLRMTRNEAKNIGDGQTQDTASAVSWMRNALHVLMSAPKGAPHA